MKIFQLSTQYVGNSPIETGYEIMPKKEDTEHNGWS
jgi:hypothetical protein